MDKIATISHFGHMFGIKQHTEVTSAEHWKKQPVCPWS